MNRNNFQKNNIDRKVDQFIEVGRQFVDGVSGARPGSRKSVNFRDFSRRNVKNVSRWVNEKVENFLDDDYEDDWGNERDIEEDNSGTSYQIDQKFNKYQNHHKKRPLEAISLRDSVKSLHEQMRLTPSENHSTEEWPKDSDFQIEKWQRSVINTDDVLNKNKLDQNYSNRQRRLPRSSRRRV